MRESGENLGVIFLGTARLRENKTS